MLVWLRGFYWLISRYIDRIGLPVAHTVLLQLSIRCNCYFYFICLVLELWFLDFSPLLKLISNSFTYEHRSNSYCGELVGFKLTRTWSCDSCSWTCHCCFYFSSEGFQRCRDWRNSVTSCLIFYLVAMLNYIVLHVLGRTLSLVIYLLV